MALESVTDEDKDVAQSDVFTPASWEDVEEARQKLLARGYVVDRVITGGAILQLFGTKAKTTIAEAMESTQAVDGELVD